MMLARTHRPTAARPGYVLLIVLMVIVVLSLAAYRFSDAMTSEQRAAVRTHDVAQARLSAVSGVHYAAAQLADPVFMKGINWNPTVAGSIPEFTLRPNPTTPQLECRFSLVTPPPVGTTNGSPAFGAVIDEGGKLNINALIMLDSSGEMLAAALSKLPPLATRPDLVDAIVDYVDADEDPRPNGAEAADYSTHLPKNGPLNSIDELLLVRGMTPQILFGTDKNRNGAGDEAASGGSLDRGLVDYLTVYGRELNYDSTGLPRINVNDSNVSEDESLAAQADKLAQLGNQELADFIMAYKMFSSAAIPTSASGSTSGSSGGSSTRAATADDLRAAVQTALDNIDTKPMNNKKVKSIFDLVNVQITLPKPDGAKQGDPSLVYVSPLADPAKFVDVFNTLMDRTTTTAKLEMVPRLNVSTTSREVLVAYLYMADPNRATASPDTYETEADAIIAARDGQSADDPATLSGAWLLTSQAMSGTISQSRFKQLTTYLTGQTMVYRVQVIGYYGKGGPVSRVEAVIDVNSRGNTQVGAPRIVYFRDLTDLDMPRGFEPPRE